MLSLSHPISRLRDFTRSYGRTSLRLVPMITRTPIQLKKPWRISVNSSEGFTWSSTFNWRKQTTAKPWVWFMSCTVLNFTSLHSILYFSSHYNPSMDNCTITPLWRHIGVNADTTALSSGVPLASLTPQHNYMMMSECCHYDVTLESMLTQQPYLAAYHWRLWRHNRIIWWCQNAAIMTSHWSQCWHNSLI